MSDSIFGGIFKKVSLRENFEYNDSSRKYPLSKWQTITKMLIKMARKYFEQNFLINLGQIHLYLKSKCEMS